MKLKIVLKEVEPAEGSPW